MDTISFLITAPAGYYIAKISYTQSGTGRTAGTGEAVGGANLVVDGAAVDLGLFNENPTLSHTIDLTDQNNTILPVSITIGLHVFATPQLGSATIAITSAEVLVELKELVELPPLLP